MDKVNIKCIICNKLFKVLLKDKKWRTKCYMCYKKMLNAKCECGKLFRIEVGEEWKTLCSDCYIK
jgi:pentatricopeptide repeat protein